MIKTFEIRYQNKLSLLNLKNGFIQHGNLIVLNKIISQIQRRRQKVNSSSSKYFSYLPWTNTAIFCSWNQSVRYWWWPRKWFLLFLTLIHFLSPKAVIHKILKKFVMLLIGFRKFNSNLLENSSRKKLQYITVNNLKWINLIFNRNQVF